MTAIPPGLGTQTVVPTADGINSLGSAAAPVYLQLANNKLRVTERQVFPASSVTWHALVASGAAVNVTTAFTNPMPPRNVRISRSGAGVATVYTVTGTRFGVAQTEVLNSNGATDVDGTKIFDTVTAWSSDVDATVSSTLKTGDMLPLSNVADAAGIELSGVSTNDLTNSVTETFTLNAARDGFTPTTVPDGTKGHFVRYRVLGTTVQP